MSLSTSTPPSPAPSPLEAELKAVGAVANTGVLGGLATIFLPLAQVLPDKIDTSTVHTCVVSGIVLIATSVIGRLAHHGYVTAKQAKVLDAAVPGVAAATAAEIPASFETRLTNVEKALAALAQQERQ